MRRIDLSLLSAIGFATLFGTHALRADVSPTSPRSLSELVSRPDAIHGKDIALANLLCAEGLPGAESLDIKSSLTLIETMARKVWQETDRLRPRFWQRPQEFYHSEAYFKMIVLVTVMQEDFGIHYNPARIAPPDKPEPTAKFFADSNDVFINGALGPKRSGTCSSLPVFYVAVGRQLGYPLKLVTAKAHLFLRWEDEREKMNIEASGRGLSIFPDDHYRKWPFPISAEEEKQGYFLRNLTPAEEVAIFLQARAQALIVHQRFAEAREAIKLAANLTPQWSEIKKLYVSYVDQVESGPPKPMLLDRGLPHVVGPAASVMQDAIEMSRASQEAQARYERSRRENPNLPAAPRPGPPSFPAPYTPPQPAFPQPIRLP